LQSAKIDVQLKATTSACCGQEIPFSISRKNYDDLRRKSLVQRVLLVLFLPSDWFGWSLEQIVIRGTAYWKCLHGMEETNNSSQVTVYLSQLVTEDTLRDWMIAAANRKEIAYVPC
jgi:hypothetical protein